MSEVESLESTYEWKIPNFRDYVGYECGKCVTSPCFRTYHSEKKTTNVVCVQWKLRIYPNGLHETGNNDTAIYLGNCSEFEVTSKYSLTIMAAGHPNNNVSSTSSVEKIFQPKGFVGNAGKYNSWGWRIAKQSLFSEQSQFLVNDTLLMYCRIFETSITSENLKLSNDSTLETRNHFENLLETGKFSDVTFTIGEKSVQLHKAILTNESPVFRAMFEHEMKEQKDNVVNIVDVDLDVMKELLRHIYAKKVNGIDEIADDLLIAADKYCLKGLKELCEQTICDNWNTDKALQYFELAVKYGAEKLKSKSVDYIVKNLKDIVKTKEFLALNLDCKNELLISMAKNQ